MSELCREERGASAMSALAGSTYSLPHTIVLEIGKHESDEGCNKNPDSDVAVIH